MDFLVLEKKPYGNMRIKDAAKYLGISPAQLRRLIHNGELHAIPGRGKNAPWLVPVEELDRWIAKNTTNIGR